VATQIIQSSFVETKDSKSSEKYNFDYKFIHPSVSSHSVDDKRFHESFAFLIRNRSSSIECQIPFVIIGPSFVIITIIALLRFFSSFKWGIIESNKKFFHFFSSFPAFGKDCVEEIKTSLLLSYQTHIYRVIYDHRRKFLSTHPSGHGCYESIEHIQVEGSFGIELMSINGDAIE
jgi:hypothetical protein